VNNRYIYILTCPISKEVKHLGITTNPYKYDLSEVDEKWLTQLNLFREEPKFEVVERIDLEDYLIRRDELLLKYNICKY